MDYRDLMILRELEEIKRRQSWLLDLSSNITGNILYEGAAYLLRGLFRKL